MFNLYLHSRVGDSNATVVNNGASVLQGWFNEICRGTRQGSSQVHTTVSATAVAENELLVYVLPSSSSSIFRRLYPGIELGQTGSTGLTSAGMLSEIYFDRLEGDVNRPRLLAAIIFHEWMHNKLDSNPDAMTVRDIHTDGGAGLASVPVRSDTVLTEENIRLMRSTLGKREPQYTAAIR